MRRTAEWCRSLYLLGLDCAGQPRKRSPPRIGGGFAFAGSCVQVLAAARAKSFAVRIAECAAGQGEKHLFPHDVFKRKTALFIIADFSLICGDRSLPGIGVGPCRAKDEVEVAFDGSMDRFETPGAELVEIPLVGGAEADVGDLVVVAAVLDDEVGAAGDGHGADLGDVWGVFERTGGDGFVEEERFLLELERGDEHGPEIKYIRVLLPRIWRLLGFG